MLFSAVKITLAMSLLAGMTQFAQAQDHSLTVYGGFVTKDTWLEALSLNTIFVDAQILVCAWSWTVKRYHEGTLTLEVEGQAARYFGLQDHLELNFPLALRWHRFPWDGAVDTSMAFGLGPSWAAEDPKVELLTHDSTSQLLIYWFLEITLGPPNSDWAGVFRLHHRSTGFGTVARDGGSNTLAAGVKFLF